MAMSGTAGSSRASPARQRFPPEAAAVAGLGRTLHFLWIRPADRIVVLYH